MNHSVTSSFFDKLVATTTLGGQEMEHTMRSKSMTTNAGLRWLANQVAWETRLEQLSRAAAEAQRSREMAETAGDHGLAA
jgi:hypothetical protein